MSREITHAAQGPFEHAYGLLMEYVDVCPDNVWAEKNGGWPVWQQVGHAIMVMDFFVRGEDEALLPAPCDMDTLMLKTQGAPVAHKKVMRDYAAAVKSRVDAWLAGMSDERLVGNNAALSKKIGRDLSYMATVIMLASHTNYHLGACDAALRDHGLKGVF
ncbi:MAG: DinB family protein [Desulfovibrio sp.]|jgi:hypothetical protein|nr:DinB family protein [Desulfovibrio sp.]